MSNLKTAIIDQWKKDLLDAEFGIKFNCDYAVITNDDGNLEGDASLFLAFRHAEITDDNQLLDWYESVSKRVPVGGYHISDVIVADYTGIPLDDACKLMWPQVLIDRPDYELSQITPKQFIAVLNVYLETGIVDWNLVDHV